MESLPRVQYFPRFVQYSCLLYYRLMEHLKMGRRTIYNNFSHFPVFSDITEFSCDFGIMGRCVQMFLSYTKYQHNKCTEIKLKLAKPRKKY